MVDHGDGNDHAGKLYRGRTAPDTTVKADWAKFGDAEEPATKAAIRLEHKIGTFAQGTPHEWGYS